VKALATDGDLLFVGGGETHNERSWGVFTVWDKRGRRLFYQNTAARVQTMAVFNDDLLVALQVNGVNLLVFDLTDSFKLKKELKEEYHADYLFVWRNNNLWFSASYGTIRVYDAQHQRIAQLKGNGWVQGVVNWKDIYIVSGGLGESSVKIWNPQTWSCVQTVPVDKWVYSLACWNDHILVGLGGGYVSILDMQTKGVIKKFQPHLNIVYGLAVYNEYLYSASADGNVSVFDANYNCVTTWKGHTDEIWQLILWQDRIVSGSRNKTVRSWKPYTQPQSIDIQPAQVQQATNSVPLTHQQQQESLHAAAPPASQSLFAEKQQNVQWATLKTNLNILYPLPVRQSLALSFALNIQIVGADPAQQLSNALEWLRQNSFLPLFVEAVEGCAHDYLDKTEELLKQSPFKDLFYPVRK
jgi:WD40 repeat protein